MPSFLLDAPVADSTMNSFKRKRESEDNTVKDMSDEIALKIHSQQPNTPFEYALTPSMPTLQRRLLKPLSRPPIGKRQRTMPSPVQVYTQNTTDPLQPLAIARPGLGPRPKSYLDLKACHICHRRPIKKSDLENYTDCDGCGERTCYVCVRECQGQRTIGFLAAENGKEISSAIGSGEAWSEDAMAMSFESSIDSDQPKESSPMMGSVLDDAVASSSWTTQHRRVVCSSCCVEQGIHGEVRCLGCLKSDL